MNETSPWADPASPVQPPYAGPPATRQPSPGPPGYATPVYGGYGYPPGGYGYPPGQSAPWPPAPQRPRPPGQVIAAAVLAFVHGGLVLLASVYVLLFGSLAGIAADADPSSAPAGVQGLAGEALMVGFVQVASAVLLIVGGVLLLNTRKRRALIVLVAAFAVQVLLCLYWAVRLAALGEEIPGADPSGVFLAFALLFAAIPVVGLGLLLVGSGRRWFEPEATPA
jgi:hypothetical protein